MPPRVNASRPPGQWQTYDILVERPSLHHRRQTREPLVVTVLHNGVVTQNHTALSRDPHKQVGTYTRNPEKARSNSRTKATRCAPQHLDREIHMPGADEVGDGPKIGQ